VPDFELAFTPLRSEDVALVHEWRQRPHVREWWSPVDTLGDVERKYRPRIDGPEPKSVYLIVLAGRPIGLIQTFLVGDYPEDWPAELEPGTAGVDLFIGDEDLLGRGLGSQVIRAFVREVVFARAGTTACVADPDIRNGASIRAFEKAGFRRAGTFRMPDGPAPQLLLRLERPELEG
jgi:RimJ/RimL family protein N-acetyltransferase